MANFFQRLFSGSFPKISWGPRMESITYQTEHNFLEISSTFMNGQRIYTESMQNWSDGKVIEQAEKAGIFKNVIRFLNKKNDSPIVVINTDYDKAFWETCCKENEGAIKGIEYTSKKEKEQFRYNSMLNTIQHNGTIMIEGRTIKTEAELNEYWQTRGK